MLDTWRRSIRGALGWLAVSAILPAQTASFVFQNEVATGGNPIALAIGNFSGNILADLVVAQQGPGSVALLRSQGQGFFTQPFPSQGIGIDPRVVGTGDFNRDGILDLVVANFGSGTVSVLLGNGNGTFRPRLNLDALSASSLVVGDFNGDGLLDLAVCHQNSNSLSIFLGNGDGTFRTPLDFAVGVGPVSIAAGDFNGDGIPDLAVANSISSSVSILLGKGNGAFRSALDFAAGPSPAFLALGDFNHDGMLDVAVANDISAGTISLLIGNGNGSLQAPLSFPVGANPAFIVAADFNLDGNLDLAVANTGADTVSILMGDGARSFVPHRDFSAGKGPAWVLVTDFNADGKPDLVVANSLSNTISMIVNVTTIPNQPDIGDHSVVNAASFVDGSVAPGEVVTIFGSNLLGTTTTTTSQTRVLFNGIPATLLYVGNDQVSAIVPNGVAGQKEAQVVVDRNGVPSGTLTIPVAASAPGLFTATSNGRGQAAALNEDLSINSSSNPAAQGSIVVLFGTGAGQPGLPVSVTIDGKSATVLYAGPTGDSLAGVIQLNVQLPAGIHSGAVPVVLRVDGGVSQPGVTLSVR
ncbi:MAG TPA: FG-GAP-like repeat-containing protein [Bryobacteraceae bacterium]|nr:FG-GAP-like repeat-containing protein [Bryobacteraceae bacterium]